MLPLITGVFFVSAGLNSVVKAGCGVCGGGISSSKFVKPQSDLGVISLEGIAPAAAPNNVSAASDTGGRLWLAFSVVIPFSTVFWLKQKSCFSFSNHHQIDREIFNGPTALQMADSINENMEPAHKFFVHRFLFCAVISHYLPVSCSWFQHCRCRRSFSLAEPG